MTRAKRKKGKGKENEQRSLSEQAVTESEPTDPVKLNAFGKALVLTAAGLAIGVVELIVFSAAATVFQIEINVATMPTNWLVVFYGLFLIPGICFFWAFAHLFDLFE